MELTAQIGRNNEHLADLSAAQARTEDVLTRLATAQARTEERVGELAQTQREIAAAQERTDNRMGDLAAAQTRSEAKIERLVDAQLAVKKELSTLRLWQQGEAGRRDGERYELQMSRSGPMLFAGGEGALPTEERVRRRLVDLLQGMPELMLWRPIVAGLHLDELESITNPFLADLVWWEGDRVAVVEISLVVDRDDVNRALDRADTLRRAGAEALPVASVVVPIPRLSHDPLHLKLAMFGSVGSMPDRTSPSQRQGRCCSQSSRCSQEVEDCASGKLQEVRLVALHRSVSHSIEWRSAGLLTITRQSAAITRASTSAAR